MSDSTVLQLCIVPSIVAVLCGAVLLAIGPLVYLPRLTRMLVTFRCKRTLAKTGSVAGEDCEFQNSDGLTLRGTYLPTDWSARGGVVLFAHEAGGDRWSVRPYLESLRGAGFDVFAFDFRSHGTSDGSARHMPRPWVTPAEVQDVRAAVDFLCSRKDADPRGVVVMGCSRGGVAALCEAATDQRVISIVADSSFAHETLLPHLIRRYAHKYVLFASIIDSVPDVLLWWFAKLALVRVLGRTQAKYLCLRRCFQQLRQPVFLIHGDLDTLVPTHVAQSVADTVRSCILWLVPGARHNNSVQVVPCEYALRVTQFISTQLQSCSTITNVYRFNAKPFGA